MVVGGDFSTTAGISVALENGIDHILLHFDGQRGLWPRAISTRTTENRQVIVNSREEAIARFAQSGFKDSKISAYPPISRLSSYVGVNLEIAPSIVMIDLDRATFSTHKAFEMALTKTLTKITKCLASKPTVLWSGSGYHIYLVLDSFVLESVDIFNNTRFGSNPSQKFLRFSEGFLSNGKCDPQHNNTVSLRNCMLRIPGSTNSKNGETVRIVQKWNGYRPSIKILLEDFYVYLCNQRLSEIIENRKTSYFPMRRNPEKNNGNEIHWIENLLRTPITDYRKLSIWRILAPYLLNIRTLSYHESYNIISRWLGECNRLKRLDFNPNYRIRSALNNSSNFLPVSCDKLKVENEKFYRFLQWNRVF